MTRTSTRVRAIAALTAVPLMLSLAACGGEASSTESKDGLPVVQMDGVVPDPSAVPVLAIKELGLDKKYGFELEYHEGDPAGGTTPFLRGEVQLGGGDAISAAIANNEGFETVAYYPFMSQTATIVASKDSGIKTPADLVGKKIGHFGDDSGTTQAISLTLADGWGIDVSKDLELVQSEPEVLPELLKQGRVDAIFDFEPFADRAVQLTDGVRVLDVAKYWQDKEDWTPPLQMLWSNRSWINDNPDVAEGVQKAFADAQQAIIDSDYQMFSEEPYKSFLDLQDDAELQRLIDYCRDLPCYTNEWTSDDADNMNDWIDRMVDAGMLDKSPSTPASEPLDQVIGGE